MRRLIFLSFITLSTSSLFAAVDFDQLVDYVQAMPMASIQAQSVKADTESDLNKLMMVLQDHGIQLAAIDSADCKYIDDKFRLSLELLR